MCTLCDTFWREILQSAWRVQCAVFGREQAETFNGRVGEQHERGAAERKGEMYNARVASDDKVHLQNKRLELVKVERRQRIERVVVFDKFCRNFWGRMREQKDMAFWQKF